MRILLLLSLAFLMVMCGNTYQKRDNGEESANVPAAVKQKLLQLYPSAASVEWEREKQGRYEAEFSLNGKQVELLIDEKGNVLRSIVQVSKEELPPAVIAELDKKPAMRLARILEVREGSTIVYRVVGLTDAQRLKLEYNDGGKLLSEAVIDRHKKKQGKISLPSAGVSRFTQKWTLPYVLTEISGMALIDDRTVACVQDELGIIFIYDLGQQAISDEISFAQPGDYEGIAIVGKDAWVLRSDGMLFHVADFRSSGRKVQEYPLALQGEQDLEGLCYDKPNNRLLIAPREPDSGDHSVKGFYKFDLGAMKFDPKPVFTISMNDPLLEEGKGKLRKSPLMPSEIAVHPANGDIYISDARNGNVIVANSTGRITRVVKLDKSIFPKTEGIAFTPGGSMYLSNEGKKQAPNVILLKKEL